MNIDFGYDTPYGYEERIIDISEDDLKEYAVEEICRQEKIKYSADVEKMANVFFREYYDVKEFIENNGLWSDFKTWFAENKL